MVSSAQKSLKLIQPDQADAGRDGPKHQEFYPLLFSNNLRVHKNWVKLPIDFLTIVLSTHMVAVTSKNWRYLRSSHSGPSLVAHWKPWMMESLTVLRRLLSTSDGSVSSTRMFGPELSGPNAHIERAASKSQSYFVWKNSPSFFLWNIRNKTTFNAKGNVESTLLI